jgi:two-component system, cell cycle sensor histidine kinase and response regulator CckA
VDALEKVKKNGWALDLLLTDVVMPNMNGADLAKNLLQIQPSLKIVFTSGYAEDIIAHHGLIDISVNFIGKPYSPVELCECIRKVLDASKN